MQVCGQSKPIVPESSIIRFFHTLSVVDNRAQKRGEENGVGREAKYKRRTKDPGRSTRQAERIAKVRSLIFPQSLDKVLHVWVAGAIKHCGCAACGCASNSSYFVNLKKHEYRQRH